MLRVAVVVCAWCAFAEEGPLLPRARPEGGAATWQKDVDKALARSGPLDAASVRKFYEDGYVVVPGLLDEATVAEAVGDVDEKQNEFAAEMVDSGLLAGPAADWRTAPWDERLDWVAGELPDAHVLFAKNGWLSPGLQRVALDQRLLDVAAQLGVPGEASAGSAGNGAVGLHPYWNLRGAPGRKKAASAVPWSQDASYYEPRVWGSLVLAAWVPLDESAGSLEFVAGSHAAGRTLRHTCCAADTWRTETTLATCSAELGMDCAAAATAAPARKGDVVFYGPTVVYRTAPNRDEKMRWSLDVRFHEVAGADAPAPGRKKGAHQDWFYGVKDSIVVRTSGGRNVTRGDSEMVDWAAVDRSERQEAFLNTKRRGGRTSENGLYDLDPVITGPWMSTWTLAHRNRHVDRYLRAQPKSVREAAFGEGAEL